MLAAPAAAKDTALQMVSIDVEGGGGTLFVTPDGKSLLIDTGNPEQSRITGDHPSSERIVAAAHELGVKKIDYLIITHYHGDHIGGIEGLLKRIPVGTVIDHGPNRETTASPNPTAPQIDMKNPPPGSTAYGYEHYMQAIAGHHHIVAKPGDVFHIGGMTVTIVAADAKVIAKPLPGAGEDNPSCAGMEGMANNGGEENARSTASVISYGKARIAAFGDLTWDREKDLFCPIDRGRQGGCVSGHPSRHRAVRQSGSGQCAGAHRRDRGQLATQGRGCRAHEDHQGQPAHPGRVAASRHDGLARCECGHRHDRQSRSPTRARTWLSPCACASKRTARSP